MNIIEKMIRDWNRRAKDDAKYWIATGYCENEEIFDKHGEENVRQILDGLESYLKKSWHVLEIGCGIGRLLRPMSSRFEYVCGVDVSADRRDAVDAEVQAGAAGSAMERDRLRNDE